MSTSAKSRIYLSSPHLGKDEFEFVKEAFATNWIAPLGPHVDAFESEFCALLGEPARRDSEVVNRDSLSVTRDSESVSRDSVLVGSAGVRPSRSTSSA